MLTTELISALELAVGPVILISAVGLLLLTLNNRLSQSITRSRLLCAEYAGLTSDTDRASIARQLSVIWRRARYLRASIEWMVGSALCSSVLVMALFVQGAFGLGSAYITGGLFIGSLACVVVGLLYFIRETRQVLTALHVELAEVPGVLTD